MLYATVGIVNVGAKDLQIANSAFTAARFEEQYICKIDGILYPPVAIDFKQSEKISRRIVSSRAFLAKQTSIRADHNDGAIFANMTLF